MAYYRFRNTVAFLYLLPLLLSLNWVISCKKPLEDTVSLRFSKSIITFDTVFSSLGSITKSFTVYNPSNKDITADILLAGGNRSYYSINVNGVSGINFDKVEIPKRDSIFIFVKVNIHPGGVNNPFLVTDSIVFFSGTRKQDVKLLAYGQDANFIVADPKTGYKVIAGVEAGAQQEVRWTREKPYVVYGWAVIDSLGKLIIEPGTKIYFHSNSGLWAYRYSNLEVNGTLEDPVVFRGDRLESWFDDDYAQWKGLWVNEGADVNMNYAIITNAVTGMQVNPFVAADGEINITPNSLVQIKNTIIKNTRDFGVWSLFLNVEMTNCVIANNGTSSLLLEGGKYSMKHVTIGNYSQADRKVAACKVSNKVISVKEYENLPPVDTKATFLNCIIYGKNETEVEATKASGADLDATFQNCLLKSKNDFNYFIECLNNKDPKFSDIKKLDFTLLPTSPAIGKGKPNIGVDEDIMGKQRGEKPDIGAYQSE